MGRRNADLDEVETSKPTKAPKAPKTGKPPKPGKAAKARRPHGPLAMWRFPASVAAGVVICAPTLLTAAGSETDVFANGQLEDAILRGAGFGIVVWFATGIVDRILHAARPDDPADDPTS